MDKEFTLYEEALALKEIGFDEPCFGYRESTYGKDRVIIDNSRLITNSNFSKVFSDTHFRIVTPTYSQAFRWFREKHELKIFFAYWNGYNDNGFENEYKYECYIVPPNGPSITVRGEDDRVYFDIYEEAELECLKQLIEIVKNKK
jgi:hypothetical protein